MKDNWINGTWETGLGPERIIWNPSDGNKIGIFPDADSDQVDRATTAASHAFKDSDWATDPAFRSKVLFKVSDSLLEHAKEIAELETKNTGKPFREALLDVEDSSACFRYYASLIPDALSETKKMGDGTRSEIINEPIGPCGLIVPWNFPLLLGIWKIAPALAAGNTIIFKPSEFTPMSILRLAELLEEAGLPSGVFNLVLGAGDVGQAIIRQEEIKKISFTGSVATGRRIYSDCASALKRVSLELGGKSPFIVCEDVDIELAAEWALFASLFNQGEVCVAAPRLLIQQSIYEPFKKTFLEKLKRLSIGDPMSSSTDMGPLISRNHLEKVQRYIESGISEGARLLIGGKRLESNGHFITPAVFENVSVDMKIMQEEIFGPVITMQPYHTEKEAVDFANDTTFGLAAGILTENKEKANHLTSKLEAGIIWVNSYHTPYVDAPWGGMKASGIGRELGIQGLKAFTEYKHVNHSSKIEALNWYNYRNDVSF